MLESALITLATARTWWTHDLDPVLWHISGAMAIRWYGLAYIAGFLGSYLLLRWYHSKSLSPLSPAHLENLFVYLVLGVMIGGRLGYLLLYQTGDFARDPLIFFPVLGRWYGQSRWLRRSSDCCGTF